ncbi:DUF2975 domain-containing protein [Clostridium sp. HV4-5-A1G]|uniref:DUF2975 domain-containing protein n=1 Tax=Clostridium sp. HV4-5-A1G TaxID=2004595 RepID=UPI001238C7C0|nr:DUF2975 domain-containing protein [Clostridium sp. HV4-5-A1G]KAA8669319.1 DUF2975 domain-containing protein [Clostridium sp. HV4-5-A1G]
MFDKDRSSIVTFLYVFLNILFVMAIIVLIFIPALFFNFDYTNHVVRHIAIAEINSIVILLVIYELKGITGRIEERKVFTQDNAVSFKRVSIYTFLLGIFYMVNDMLNGEFHILFAFNKDGSMKIDVVVFIVLGCVFLVISQVLAKAVEIKRENDLTI